jgi:hypothetical protein
MHGASNMNRQGPNMIEIAPSFKYRIYYSVSI